jgi:hypothetical protein
MTFLYWLDEWLALTRFEDCNLETVQLVCAVIRNMADLGRIKRLVTL